VPALLSSGWDIQHQVREEYFFTAGQVLVKGKTVKRGKRKFADFLLSFKTNMPLALIEAKDNNHSIGSGMQQGLDYARTLDVPYVFSTNGDGFLFHDRLNTSGTIEQELKLDQFPSPTELWDRYCQAKKINQAALPIVSQDNILTAVAACLATTRQWPSIESSKRSAMAENEHCWSWQQVRAKRSRHFRSSGDSGNPARPNAFCSWLTGTF